MFFFFPFFFPSQPSSNGASAPHVKALPYLPASGSARANARGSERGWDFGNPAVDLMRQTLELFSKSLTALGNAANAMFAQMTAMMAWDRVARDSAQFLGGAWTGFGAPKGRTGYFGAFRPDADPMSFSPFLTQGFNPFAFNPWAAFAEGLNFWASLWMPAAPQRNPYSFNSKAAPSPFMAKVSTPNGFSWGFAWGG